MAVSKAGLQVATQDHQHNGRILATFLIEAGFFTLQTKKLLPLLSSDGAGGLTCQISAAVEASPQLTGVVLKWPGTREGPLLRIPAELTNLLVDSAELAPLPRIEGHDSRKEIGNRGEAYSFRFERLQAEDPAKVHWVAPEDETLGYDVEDLNSSRLIEVKASVTTEIRFHMSANEYSVMHENSDRYVVHFWGGINLERPRRKEYEVLTSLGYPIVINDLPSRLTDGTYRSTPSEYVITEAKTAT